MVTTFSESSESLIVSTSQSEKKKKMADYSGWALMTCLCNGQNEDEFLFQQSLESFSFPNFRYAMSLYHECFVLSWSSGTSWKNLSCITKSHFENQ